MAGRELGIRSTVLLVAVLCVGMLLPYFPGRFDASAATLSFLIRVASYASLLFTPLGLAWMIRPRRFKLWRRVTRVLIGLVGILTAVAALTVNQLAIGVMIGIGAAGFIWGERRRMQADSAWVGCGPSSRPICLTLAPVLLTTFQTAVLPCAAEWSRERAIEHSATLIAEIELFRKRNGHYPASLQSLNPDVSTGVVGIERFLYEPNGEAYNLFFVRPHIELDAKEVVMFNPRDEHRFTSHELDLLQSDGERLDLRRGDRRRTPLRRAHWTSILFD